MCYANSSWCDLKQTADLEEHTSDKHGIVWIACTYIIVMEGIAKWGDKLLRGKEVENHEDCNV